MRQGKVLIIDVDVKKALRLVCNFDERSCCSGSITMNKWLPKQTHKRTQIRPYLTKKKHVFECTELVIELLTEDKGVLR